MQFPEDVTDDVHRRLRRLEGQIRGLQRLVDEGADCKDIVTQLSASRAALDRIGYKLIAAGMRHCATSRDPSVDADELEELFLKLS